jgi:hypothetical protein
MSSVIQNLLENTLGDGARASKFEVYINLNGTGLFGNEKDITMLVKTSQFPGKTHETIDVKFKGRTIPIKGQVKYSNTWECEFYLSEDHSLKRAFEDWIESLDQVHNMQEQSGAVADAQALNSLGYTTNLRIVQMDFIGNNPKATYTLYNCFPTSVSSLSVDYSQLGEILAFGVEFSYSHYDVQ